MKNVIAKIQLMIVQFSFLKGAALTFVSLISLAMVVLSIIDFAYYSSAEEQNQIEAFYQVVRFVFLLEIIIQIIFNFKNRYSSFKKTIPGIILLTTFLPLFIPSTDTQGLLFHIEQFIDNKYYFTFALLSIAFSNLGQAVIGFLGKKTNRALIMATSFFIIILIGTFLLMSPRSGLIRISFIDALFVSTSAVCVTGLTPLDIATAFTIEGKFIILMLIQIGGLGVMTLTTFFALFFMGNMKISNQLTVREMIAGGTLQSLFSMLLNILVFTLIIEGIGAFFIWYSIHKTMGMNLMQELFFSVFHSISAFCNAGFSTLSGNLGNPLIMFHHNLVFIVISLLIIFGGIGFPILVNLKNLGTYYLKRLYFIRINKKGSFQRMTHVININTKIVLITTTILIFGGTAMMALFEWNGAFAFLPTEEKLIQSFFNSVATRTAGFTSINLTLFSSSALLIYMLLMWIGGAAQSTAGGIKVNTLATAFLAMKAILRSESRVEIFKREIAGVSVMRAFGTIFVSIIILATAIFILNLLEPDISLFGLAFECISAIGTVGSSLDITQLLSSDGKLLIIFLMFTGRIGMFTLIMSFIKRKPKRNYRFPEEQIIIN